MPGDLSKTSQIAITVDVVVYTERDKSPEVLLVKRADDPFRGSWAFPGGFVEVDEDLPDAARRELAEETSIVAGDLTQLGAYGSPGRDPRMRVVTVVFWTIVDGSVEPEAGDDAAEARFWQVAELRADPDLLAFDHIRILDDALSEIAGAR